MYDPPPLLTSRESLWTLKGFQALGSGDIPARLSAPGADGHRTPLRWCPQAVCSNPATVTPFTSLEYDMAIRAYNDYAGSKAEGTAGRLRIAGVARMSDPAEAIATLNTPFSGWRVGAHSNS